MEITSKSHTGTPCLRVPYPTPKSANSSNFSRALRDEAVGGGGRLKPGTLNLELYNAPHMFSPASMPKISQKRQKNPHFGSFLPAGKYPTYRISATQSAITPFPRAKINAKSGKVAKNDPMLPELQASIQPRSISKRHYRGKKPAAGAFQDGTSNQMPNVK